MSINETINQTIQSHDVVLYMKGDPDFPQCGFSGTVVQILNLLGVDYHGENVLLDANLRQGIKDFSDWPTIPQLYIKGEFIGGCDIIRELYQSGELKTTFQDKGLKVKI